ncbi:MAG TPA: 4-coumarate--CoA ligase family protein [Chloroflexota bacterium]|nr:4-coumarate--CoA ligase family protein [Chloroflexota bacterium]
MSLAQETIFRSPYPDVPIPEVSFHEFVLGLAGELPDRAALIDGTSGRVTTYAQLQKDVRSLAAGLARRGFKQGDVFAIYAPNVPEYATAFLAVASLGGINTTINPLYTADELRQQLQDARARFLLTVPAFIDKARVAAGQAGIEEVFSVGEANAATPFEALLAPDAEPPQVRINPREDLVVLPYSSGTTGLSKGVMLTHHNLVANLCQFGSLGHYREGDRIIAVLPFFHIYGMVVIMSATLYKGGTLVTLPRFELEHFLQVLQDYKITVAYLVPPIVLALAKHPAVDKYDLSSIRLIFSGAAPLSQELEQAASQRLGGCSMLQGYGLTETSPVTHSNASRDLSEARAGSVGRPVPNTECKIVDPATGEALGPGQQGEVCVRGPQVMKGYLNNPEATRQMLKADGWMHTGDIGYVDADGFLYIVDRLKELIKYKGMQVPPAELEAVLLTHPAVADAAVIPSPDEEAGEIPKAFVVLKSQATASPDELMAYVAERVAPHKRVRGLEFIGQVPKSASGKILRRVLVAREREQVRRV